MILFQTYSFHIYNIRTCIDRSVVSFDLKGKHDHTQASSHTVVDSVI